MHRWLFGENFRKEWAASVKLPLIDITKVEGGLNPLKFRGGMETKSIRMIDKTGKEWVIRSVEKTPDKLLPENLKQTFALDWVDDEYSGQHPYSALVVPPLADAARVPHTNPVIGVLVPNPVLNTFGKVFAGKVVLLEEREPLGKSESTINMLKSLNDDNNNRFNGEEFLRARMLDMLIGDWDRHEDQWRWIAKKIGKQKILSAVPRDRDQVFHVNQGVFPSLAALPWVDPVLGNFKDSITHVKYALFKTRFIQQDPDAQFSYTDWMRIVNDFTKAETDSVLEAGLDRLPKELYPISHNELLKQLKKRHDRVPVVMAECYRFINRIIDIRASDKDEDITIEDAADKDMRIVINSIDKKALDKKIIMDVTYLPKIIKEIRLYTADGNDKVIINNSASPIKLRVIGADGQKTYEITQAYRKIQVYEKKDSSNFTGNISRLSKHLSDDTLNTRFLPTDPYNVWMPLATGAINKDDGFLLGLGFRYVGHDGFRNRLIPRFRK